MPGHLKVKLTLIVFCLCAVAASHIYFAGIDAGVRAVDDDAFNAFTHFAKQMHAETHKPVSYAQAEPSYSVFDAPKHHHGR